MHQEKQKAEETVGATLSRSPVPWTVQVYKPSCRLNMGAHVPHPPEAGGLMGDTCAKY